MKAYDWIAGDGRLLPSRFLSRQEALARFPGLNANRLSAAVSYSDGQFDDARLAVNLAQTAEDLGAAVLNYCRCVELIKEDGLVAGIQARDQESGAEFTIRARAFVSTRSAR